MVCDVLRGTALADRYLKQSINENLGGLKGYNAEASVADVIESVI